MSIERVTTTDGESRIDSKATPVNGRYTVWHDSEYFGSDVRVVTYIDDRVTGDRRSGPTVYRGERYGAPVVEVNWPSIGAVDADTAEAFAAAMLRAVGIAKRLGS